MRYFFSVLIILSLVLFNIYLYFHTEKKISEYEIIPPFRTEDFTFSNQIDKNSKLIHLKDKDEKTSWIKFRESRYQKHDAEIEFSLTHFKKGSIFYPKNLSKIKIETCDPKPEKISLDLYLREAINVDKELRLPNSFFQNTIVFEKEDNIKNFELKIKLNEEKVFPNGIYIYTAFIKTFPEKEKTCISEISLY